MPTGKQFWDAEYKEAEYFSLSERPAEDLLKFCRWIERESGRQFLNLTINVLDLGCGNGRNIIYLAQTYGCHGVGYDISEVAIKQAKIVAKDLSLKFEARNISGKINLPDSSADLILDMMASHYLPSNERSFLVKEIARVLKPSGLLLHKTFLLDQDINAHNLIRKYPAGELNSYIHPTIGALEHVSTEAEIRATYEPYFDIKKIEKSGKHILHGKAGKRRSIIVYMEKKY